MEGTERSVKRVTESTAREVEGQEHQGRHVENLVPEYAEEMARARRYRQDVARFPGEFVALSSTGIIAHSSDLLDLMARLEQTHQGRIYIVSVPTTHALAV